ncbi:hypothetical protein LDL77_19235 [Flagellimonas marinaquae]|uniref:hypothetical protein n=1 Tax=Flagellimonas aurea TaxID=2915619 RepID=UPI001CE0F06C|nr:hypothetical protein LDL77_19235 [Allomuricauda aquimarina]
MKTSAIKSKFWMVIFFLCFLICIIFTIDSFHFAFSKQRTWANILSIQNQQSNKYKIKLTYYNGEKIVKANKIIKDEAVKELGKAKQVEIYYRSIFKNEIYFVNESPNFYGQGFVLLFTGVLFFIGFYTSKENHKMDQLI